MASSAPRVSVNVKIDNNNHRISISALTSRTASIEIDSDIAVGDNTIGRGIPAAELDLEASNHSTGGEGDQPHDSGSGAYRGGAGGVGSGGTAPSASDRVGVGGGGVPAAASEGDGRGGTTHCWNLTCLFVTTGCCLFSVVLSLYLESTFPDFVPFPVLLLGCLVAMFIVFAAAIECLFIVNRINRREADEFVRQNRRVIALVPSLLSFAGLSGFLGGVGSAGTAAAVTV